MNATSTLLEERGPLHMGPVHKKKALSYLLQSINEQLKGRMQGCTS
jgi:hypothetical protein